MYGDSYFNINLNIVSLNFAQDNKDALMVVIKNDNRWDVSNVHFENGALLGYNKLAPTCEMRHIDYGISVLNKKLLLEVPENTLCDLADFYSSLLACGKMAGYEVTERFYEIGSFSGIMETAEYLSRLEGSKDGHSELH